MKNTISGFVLLSLSLSALSANSSAYSEAIDSITTAAATVKCSDHEIPKSKVLSERAGKKIMTAYDHYMDESIDELTRTQETVEQLQAINAKSAFDEASTNRFLGQILYQQEGKSREAIQTLAMAVNEKVLNDKEHADTLQLLGDLSFREEAFAEGIAWHQKWIAFTCDHNPFLYTQLATAYTQLSDYDKVIEMADMAIYYSQQVKSDKTTVALTDKELASQKKPFELKINAYHEQKDFKQALEVAEILITQFPNDEQWWPRLGFLYMAVEDFDKALATFYLANKKGFLSKAIEYRALVQLYASNNVPYTSAKLHKKYIGDGIFESSAQEWAKLANTLQLAREYPQAASYYGLAAKQSQDPEYYRKQGVLLMTAEQYDEAIKALNLSLDTGIEDPLKVHFSLMEAHFFAGNYEQAMKHADKAKQSKNLYRNTEAWIPYIQQKIEQQARMLRASL
jgi:tetratricopeptide (TPR) repeat protein